MKTCLYSKCGKEFKPNKPKQKFCCDVHRVYYAREQVAKNNTTENKKRAEKERNTPHDIKAVNPQIYSEMEAEFQELLKQKQNANTKNL